MSIPLVLEAKGISKTFPGVKALDNVNLELRKGEIHALVGENGAGKSTLMHILGGIYQADEGQVFINGRELKISNAHDAANNGISVVFQELSVVPNLSVAENIFANRQPVNGLNMIKWNVLNAEARKMLQMFEVEINPKTLVKYLPIANQQVVEILKAMSYDPKVLILDEPTSSLTKKEVDHLFKNLNKLRDKGISIIYISHHLKEIFQIADRVSVLRDGKNVDTRDINEITEDDVVKMMVGRKIGNIYESRSEDSIIGDEYFRVEDVSRKKAFQNISFSVRKGEIVGFAGLVGAGRTEVGRAIFGAEPVENGRIYFNNQELKIKSPKDAIKNGIGYISEDRKLQGLYLRMNVKENLVSPSLNKFTEKSGFLNEDSMEQIAKKYIDKFWISTPGTNQKVENLSGGNQQKVLLATWFGIEPKLLIVDEPTRGVDVGSKNQIYKKIRQLAEEGIGIVVISSDLLEILGISDRIIVMRNGEIAGEFSRSEATEENIIACAASTNR